MKLAEVSNQNSPAYQRVKRAVLELQQGLANMGIENVKVKCYDNNPCIITAPQLTTLEKGVTGKTYSYERVIAVYFGQIKLFSPMGHGTESDLLPGLRAELTYGIEDGVTHILAVLKDDLHLS